MKIDCIAMAKDIKTELMEHIEKLEQKPHLVTIMVGNNPRSEVYVGNKCRVLREVGASSEVLRFNEDITERELLDKIVELNFNDGVNGILVQLPLPKHISEDKVATVIHPSKDVDGFNCINMGRLFRGEEALYPCTPLGVLEIIDRHGYDLEGKDVLVIGRSNILGKPVAQMLMQRNATVLQIHSKSYDVQGYLHDFEPEVVISCVGKEDLVRRHMFRSETKLVIDCAVEKNSDGKVHGDVSKKAYEYFNEVGIDYTTVPNGVGRLTTVMLAKNLVKAYEMQGGK